jgi:uncharacterized SAM-binding protein YcdF (DUF218 family)
MYSLLLYFAQPYPVVLILLGAAVAAQLWTGAGSRRLRAGLAAAYLSLVALSLPPAAYLALGTLEWPYPPSHELPEDVQVLVVLSGSIIPPNQVRQHAELGVDTLYRCLHAARLQRRFSFHTVVVSGGKVESDSPGPTLARAMSEFLAQQGVDPDRIVIEESSRSTYENARQSSELLRQRGVKRIVLVTDAASLRRAAACFRRQGIDVVPSGCRYRATELGSSVTGWLPNCDAAGGVGEACHEWLGLVWYWLHGRI